MSRKTDTDDVDRTRTTVQVERTVWRQLRADAVAEVKNISERLEEILAEHYGVEMPHKLDNGTGT
jgi:hypothetical protein